MREIDLNITPEIINVAVQRDSAHCVIADAFRQARPDLQRVSVDLQTIRATDPATGTRYIWFTPALAQALLVNFDQGIRPEPGLVIRLRRPCQIIKHNQHQLARKRARERERRGEAITTGEASITNPGRVGQPTKSGGTPPPLAALANTRGRRRTFGLRSLKP